jgi:molybdopterin molybdotransferase
MMTLDDALALIRHRIQPLGAETVPLDDAHRRWLAAPLIAARTQPPFDASAMDGYAVRSADLKGVEVTLTLAGESAAGHASHRPLGAGEAIRISTGAPLPAGADQVVIQENCQTADGRMTTAEPPRPGANIRRAGIDFMIGDTLLETGQHLTPVAISLAASAGHSTLLVSHQPVIGILSTGDELVEAGEDAAPDQIINSIAPGLSALIEACGGQPRYLGIARDDPADVRDKLSQTGALDLLVTIGGASVGDHDHLRRVFGELGGELFFGKIAIKPGKPTWFGQLGTTPVIGLPGNPVSAMVMAQLCLKPAIHRMLGIEIPTVFRAAKLSGVLPANGPRENMIRAQYDIRTGQIRALANQDSSVLSALVASNALIRRPAHAAAADAGETVEFLPLESE